MFDIAVTKLTLPIGTPVKITDKNIFTYGKTGMVMRNSHSFNDPTIPLIEVDFLDGWMGHYQRYQLRIIKRSQV